MLGIASLAGRSIIKDKRVVNLFSMVKIVKIEVDIATKFINA